jgi:putative tryptophan/tyrosine transport system substrate-binding protein
LKAGITTFEDTMSGKWLSLLKEIAPHTARVGVLVNRAAISASNYMLSAMGAAAPSLGLQIASVDAHNLAGIESAFETFVSGSTDAVVVMPDVVFPFFSRNDY